MSSLSSLGLSTGGPNYAPAVLVFHFIYAYGVLSSRTLKQYYGIDHNASPRYDLVTYGEEAVKSGKITRRQLGMMQRTEAASANSVENYTLLVAALAFATFSGVAPSTVNRAGLVYTAARLVYGVVYVLVDHPQWSQIRGIMWWTGNLSCFYLLFQAFGKLRG